MNNECKVCAKTFLNPSNLKRHVRKFHKEKINELAPSYKIRTDYKFKCGTCAKNFNYQRHLRYHERKIHGVTIKLEHSRDRTKCSMCDFKAGLGSEIIKHFQLEHNITIQFEELQFHNAETFEKWKRTIEKTTDSRYVKKKGFSAKSYEILKYICHRSGNYVTSGKGKKRLKKQGSNKIGGYCPASLTIMVGSDGKYKVKYLKTHVGHQTELEHLYLTPVERQAIAEKIASKVPFSVILDEVRNSAKNSKLERIHLLTRKDLHNIKGYKPNSTSLQHKEDAVSSEAQTMETKHAGSDEIKIDEHLLAPDLILKETSKDEGNSDASSSLLFSKKNQIRKRFLELLDSATSLQQLEVFEKNFDPIAATMAALSTPQFKSPTAATSKDIVNMQLKIEKPSDQ